MKSINNTYLISVTNFIQFFFMILMPDESIPITPFQNEIVNIPKTPRLVAFIPFVFKRK